MSSAQPNPRAIRPFEASPNPHRFDDVERLERDITELSAHIAAANCQLLELLAVFDEQRGWSRHGLASCAHWLQWQCGTNLGAAREKVRVARALAALPKIREAFRLGTISYSKVRAMTRVATSKNEEFLLNIARYGTAHHVEKLVRNYRRHQRMEWLKLEQAAYAGRELSIYRDDDGWILKGRFSAEQGILIKQALEKAMDVLFEERRDEHPDVSAETPSGGVDDDDLPHPVAARRADALERMAEAFLAGSKESSCGGDRHLVNVHTEADVLPADGAGSHAECEGCGNISAETSRRISCDASVVRWREDEDGELLNIGRKTRTIPPAIRRALHRRDGGCRFPGCSCRRFVDAHHIVHWADGGETSLHNLVLLCRRHHRLVHEGGFGVHAEPDGEIWFSYPTSERLPDNADGRFRGNAVLIRVKNRHNGLDITPDTLPSLWRGEIMDYNDAQMLMEQLE